MEAAQAILKRTPPSDLGKNLKWLADHSPLKDDRSVRDKVETKHPIPFTVLEELQDKPFLLCKYNRVGNRHRSPWTNMFYPFDAASGGSASADDSVPGDEELRLLEAKFNQVWESYKNLYYGHDSVGSVYLQDREDTTKPLRGGFHGVFGIQKRCPTGGWDSIHIVHVDEPTDRTCTYRVESSVLMVLETTRESSVSPPEKAHVDLSAYISKETTKTCKVSQAMLSASHIENLGTLIEANEIDLRSSIERVHVPKTQEIMNDIQKTEPKRPVAVNPLMGMIMNSEMLKKKLASEASGS
jgi:capping protein beta